MSSPRSRPVPSETCQKFVDLGRTLLLDPVTRTGDQVLAYQPGAVRVHRVVLGRRDLKDDIQGARRKDGRLQDLRPVKEGRHRPVPIKVAIPVDGATKTRTLKLSNEMVEVGLG